MDADGAVVHKLSYVKEAKSDMFGPGAERLVADDVESGRVVDVYRHLFELVSKPKIPSSCSSRTRLPSWLALQPRARLPSSTLP